MQPLQPVPTLPTSGATQEEWGLYNGLVLMHRQIEREDAEDKAKVDYRKDLVDIDKQKVELMKAEVVVNAAIALLVDRTTTTTSAATMAAEVVKCVGYAKAVVDASQAAMVMTPTPTPTPDPVPAPTPAPAPGSGLTR